MNNIKKNCEFPYEYCVLDLNILYHALKRVDRFNYEDESSRKILIKLIESPSDVKVIIDADYFTKLHTILTNPENPKDTDTMKLLKFCNLFFLGRKKTKYIEEFYLNSEQYITYEQYIEELGNSSPKLRDDDFFLFLFSRMANTLVITNDEEAYNALIFKEIPVFYSNEAIERFDP